MKHQRDVLDLQYFVGLKILDTLFDNVSARAGLSIADRNKLMDAKEYFHTKDEASHGGSDAFRRQTFEELQLGIDQMTALVKILNEKTNLSVMEAKELVKDFRCF